MNIKNVFTFKKEMLNKILIIRFINVDIFIYKIEYIYK